MINTPFNQSSFENTSLNYKNGYNEYILQLKNKYPDVRMDEENIILLTTDEHADVESDIYKFDIINQRRNKLLKK